MMDDTKGQLSNSAADIYEQYFVPALFGEWAQIVSKEANISRGDKVLDVACGTGALTREAAKIVGEAARVIGLDLNVGMIDTAKKVSPDIDYKVAPAEAIPFDNETFDCVVSQFGLMFFADQVKGLSEMARVLKPGGQLTVASWDGLNNNPGYAAAAALLARLFGEKIADELRAPYHLGDVKILHDLCRQAGIDNIEIKTKSATTRYQSIEAWMHLDVKAWTIGDMISDDQYDQLVQEAKVELSSFVKPDGQVEFPSPAHLILYKKI